MKITRRMLLIAITVLGVLLISYGALRHFTDFTLGEKADKYVSDVIIFSALGLFLYNRKMIKDERAARAAKEEEERRAAEGETEPEEEAESPDDENLPHWERHE